MLELALSTDDVARIRFAFSPLWETVISLRVLRGPAANALHLPWVRRARAALADLDVSLLTDLVPMPRAYIPDFLTPPPTTPVPELADELSALRATGADQVRHDLDRAGLDSPRLALLRDDPPAGLAELADELAGYFRIAIAPHWSRIRGLLEGEIAYRGRRLAEGGAHLLFQDLHERIRWDTDRLYVDMHHWKGQRTLAGEGVLLVPSVFAAPSVYTISQQPWQPTLMYPPRGIATIWESGRAAGPDGLAEVLGRARAALLAGLAAPATTTELSRRTGLTAGGVSQHLGALRRAGLVVAHRTGRSVLYARTETADALMRSSSATG